MADKPFGVKQLDILGGGTPTIQSPNDLNLNANTVAISTNLTVGNKLSITSTGIVTASSGVVTYFGDGSNLTGISAGFSPDADENLYAGTSAGTSAGSGSCFNVALGFRSGCVLNGADNSVFIGKYTGCRVTSGNSNLLFGFKAGRNITGGSYNMAFGYRAGGGAAASASNNQFLVYDGTQFKPTSPNTTIINEGTNLYFTNTRVESYLGSVSFDKHQDVNFTSLANDDVLQYNTGSSKWENKKLGYTVANWIVDNDTATSSVSGATLGGEAASGLSSTISIADASTKVRVTAQVRFTGSSTGSSDINIRLYRNKGGSPEALLSEWTAEDCNSTAKKFTASFDFYDTPGTVAAHTYSVYYHASDNNATLTPNPAFSTGSGTPANYIQAIEVLVNSSILANIVEDTTPQLGGVLDAQTNKIQNLGSPVAGTDAATKTYVDTQLQSKDTLAELTDVDTTGVANNKILKYNSTSSKWEISDDNYDDGLNNVSEDTSPELGGNLNATNFDIINIKDGQFGGNVVINGNLTVSGDTTTVDVTQLEVEDPMIYLNRSGQENTATYDSGILIERYDSGNQNHAGMIWDESDDEFAFFTSPNITASTTTVTGMVYANVRAGDVKTKNILPDTNTTYDIGSSSAQYNTVYAKATSAQYADLAELYRTDKEYEPGTVLIFGGEAEVTESTEKMDHRVAGVVSLSPAYLMNSTEEGLTSPVALRGKVQVNVIGPVKKGDLIVTSDTPGVGQAHPSACSSVYVIGKCIEDDDTENLVRLITCVI
mgnify:CR=1 FL=1